MAASDRTHIRGASFPIPDGFEVVDATALPSAAGGAEASDVVVLRRAGAHDDIIPTITLRADDPAPITDTSEAVLRAALDDPGAFVISCDVWPAGDVPARRLLFTRPFDDNRDATVDVFVWAASGGTVRLAAQCAVHEHLALQPVFAAMAQGLTLTEGDA